MQQERFERDVEKLRESLGEMPPPAARPAFIVLSGLPGSGKTHFCRDLVKQVPGVVLESDALRKALFPRPTYSAPESAYLFQAIHLLVARLLSEGIPTILDATNLTERNREYLYNIADRSKARLVIVWIEAPPEVVQERLRQRSIAPGPAEKSEAGLEIYQKMREQAEQIGRQHFVVDTSRDMGEAVLKIALFLKRTG